MSEIKLFENPEFGQVRTMVIDGEPWFVGKDVALALGYGAGKSLANAVAKHVDAEDKGVTEMMTPGGKQNITIINESGLYSLILSSKLPKAKEFKRWVTSEVLPSIRKTGMYQVPQTKEELYRTAFLSAMEDMKALEAQVEEMEPKATYHDMVLQTPDLVTTTVVAKDFGLTAAGLNKILHDEGVQYKQGRTWVPYKEYAEKGYMRSSTSLYTDGEGEQHSSVLYKWTQKGRLFVYELLAEKDIHPVMEMGDGEEQKVVNLFE